MSTIIFNFIRTLTAWNFGEREAANQKIAVALATTGQWDTNGQCEAQDKHRIRLRHDVDGFTRCIHT
jgi:hypothetical protein